MLILILTVPSIGLHNLAVHQYCLFKDLHASHSAEARIFLVVDPDKNCSHCRMLEILPYCMHNSKCHVSRSIPACSLNIENYAGHMKYCLQDKRGFYSVIIKIFNFSMPNNCTSKRWINYVKLYRFKLILMYWPFIHKYNLESLLNMSCPGPSKYAPKTASCKSNYQ